MSNRLFWPLILIAAGVLFLLDNLGWLHGNAWGWIWPLVLIFVGAGLLLGWRGGSRLEPVEDSLTLEGATSAALTFKHGAGELRVSAGSNAALLYEGTFYGGVDKRVDRAAGRLDVTLQGREADWWQWMGPWGSRRGLEWDVRVSREVPLALRLETGASSTKLDLEPLRVTEVVIKTGASATEMTLPANAGHSRVSIESGAASVEVRVPAGVAARIQGVMGVGTLDVDQSRFPRRGGAYESPNFEQAANRADIDVRGGVGSVSVR